MQTYLIIGGLLIVVGGAFALLLRWYGNAREKQGEVNVRNELNKETIAADRRADAVLAEHRDPNDGAERLQRGDF